MYPEVNRMQIVAELTIGRCTYLGLAHDRSAVDRAGEDS